MIPFKSFIKLPSEEKVLAIKALFWVILMRVFIWIFPFAFVKKRVQKITERSSNTSPSVTMNQIRFLVIMASRYVPRATCLVQALAGYILFSRYGYSTQIKIGVLNEDGQFEAHAWLEHDNLVVLGESEKNFKTIMDIGLK